MIDMAYLRPIGLAVVFAAALVQPAGAVVRPKGAEPPMVTTGRAPRLHRDVEWAGQGVLDRAGFRGWTAIYDRDTDVPLRMWGPGQLASGAMASPSIAEAWARRFLAEHLAVLAPGAAPGDFVVVANQLNPSGDVRSIGFLQRANGIAVLGGTISFAFKNDRMIMVGSTALPHVATAALAAPVQRLAAARVTSEAAAWLGAAGHAVVPRGGVAASQVIVPIVHPRTTSGADITYTLAEQVAMETTTGAPGRWNVFVDARTGAAFARETTLMFATGTVQFDVPVRAPFAAAGRTVQSAANATLKVNGDDVTTGLDGVVTWTGTAPATVGSGLVGPFVQVTNEAGALFTESLSLADGGAVVFSHPTEEVIDAQFDAFIYANEAKHFARTQLDPTLAYLDQLLSVSVNDNTEQCNAFSTGDDIHFFRRTVTFCENTGRMADVVYHEFGHSIHAHAIIPGVGQFNGSMSEGVADTLAVSMTGDSGMGRGFFFDNTPLRELNPVEKKIWPRDATGEVHDEGEIYGEAMWDLRGNLQASMGVTAGFEQFLKIYYGTVQRAVDIPSSFAEALVADDDDGDLANGTPHSCDIITAFAAHGLYDPVVARNVSLPVRDNFTISVATAVAVSGACQIPTVRSAVLEWRRRGGDSKSELPLAANGGRFSATIPTQPDGSVVEYQVTLTLSNGEIQVFPTNKGEPFYQFYVGPVTKLWCADFEDGAADWTHRAVPAERDPWEAVAPLGLGGDPKSAFAGARVLGTALTQIGTYPPLTTMSAESPEIDLQGHTNVHLQYYRWLGVEDGFYDRAVISANAVPVWRNFASTTDPGANGLHHIDQEWQFHDVDVSSAAARGTMKLTFALTSDPGLEAAGWNIDEVCLVALESDGGGCCDAGTGPAGPAGLAVLVLGLVWRRRRASSSVAQRLPSLR
jgi:uncharacterized protein (TIGR03382 family)